MTIQDDTSRAPFAAHTRKSDKRRAGRTDAPDTQLELRMQSGEIDEALRDWVYERLGRQLGKYAPQIERVQVRFGDINGHRGGVDKSCLVHVILSKLPTVVAEARGGTEREAFDLAARRAERATRRNVERHGFSTKHDRQKHDGMAMSAPMDSADGEEEMAAEPIFDRRAGRTLEQLMIALERPEKERRDLPIDTSEPGVSSEDRKAGYGHTAKRNTKLNTRGMKYALEDSTSGQPSRRSSRRGINRIKTDNALSLRTKNAVQSPQSKASRSRTRGT